MKWKDSIIKKLCTTILGLLILFAILPLHVDAARTKKEVQELLAGYEDWIDWASLYTTEGVYNIHFSCPEEDITYDEMIYYLEDITTKLKGKSGTDECTIAVSFPYSTAVFKQDVEYYGEEVFELYKRLSMRWSDWSYMTRMRVFSGYSSVGNNILSYNISIGLTLNGGSDVYRQAVEQIVKEAKEYGGTDEYKIVTYFCQWLFDNVEYDLSLEEEETNDAELAIVDGKAICGGFASSLYDLCAMADIPCMTLKNDLELNHAWNEVYVNNKWYTVDLVGPVTSLSGQTDFLEGKFLLDDPAYQCDDPEFLQRLKDEIFTPTPIFTKRGTIVLRDSLDIKKHIANLADDAKVTYKTSNKNIVSVDKNGIAMPGNEGNATIKVTVVQNGKTYNLMLDINSKFPKRGAKLTYNNGIYKVVKPAKKNGNKITAGTVAFVGLSDKSQTSFTMPEKFKIGKATYQIVQIGKNAFSGCSKLKKLTIKTTKLTSKTVGAKAFKGVNGKATIKVPKKKLSAYKTLFKSKGAGKNVKIK